MIKRKAFCAIGGYAANVLDPNNTVIMLMNNASELARLDDTKLITLNLHKRIVNTPNEQWDDVILDTMGLHANGDPKGPAPTYAREDGIDLLTIGPKFPGAGVGGLYIERTAFFNKYRDIVDPQGDRWPDPGRHPCQFMSSATLEGDQITRYHGFLATVTSSHGAVKQVDIGGHSLTVDMKNRSQCDDPAAIAIDIQDPRHPERAERALNANSQRDDVGAIFLPLRTCVANLLFSPKLPVGGDGYDFMRRQAAYR